MRFLAGFPTEQVKIEKPDGKEIATCQALIDPTSKLITIDNAKLRIEENDIISRTLPSGDEEYFIVIDRGFVRGMHGIPDHYQVKVKKKTGISDTHTQQTITTYNIGNAQKVNIHSVDNSISNTLTQSEKELFETLIALAEKLPNGGTIKNIVSEMEHSVGTPSFAEEYNRFIQSIANHITIFAPFIPLLTPMLIK